MLQLTKFYEQCYQEFRQLNNINNSTKHDLEKVKLITTFLFNEIDNKRASLAKKNILYQLDQFIWTDTIELIDDPSFNIEIKKEIIQGLHLKNRIFGTYNKTINILSPIIAEINQNENRPARILELGSGLGKLTFAMYEKAKKLSMPIKMTGSDIIPEYVNAANDEAAKKNCQIDYKIIDAFHLDQIEKDSYDIIFTLHSMHHFPPEQLAMIMSGSQDVATKAFIGIDAYRGFGNLSFMILAGLLASICKFNSSFLHDSLVSARKMYSAKQLEIMAMIGCPQSTIISENLKPGLTVIKIFTNKSSNRKALHNP